MSTAFRTAVTTATLLAAASPALAYFQGFEDPAFTPGGNDWNNYNGGDIQRVATGTNGITSADGAAHAIITNLSNQNNVFGNPTLGAQSPFTRFGGYSSSFGSGYSTSLDVYLDTSWSDGQGFDYSSAINRQNGNHLRDFIFHVGVDQGSLIVNASNNSDYSFNAFKLNNENSGNNYTVTTSGWYTLEHVFYENAGSLAVDFNLLDDLGNTLYSVTRSNASDDIATTVGGNRYGWITYNNIDGLAIDNSTLTAGTVIPTPAGFAAGLLGLAAVATRRR